MINCESSLYALWGGLAMEEDTMRPIAREAEL
jgi:hypothetical protein